jgi:hypothetical protein
MGNISFGVSPIRDHAVFKQPQLHSLLGHDLPQRASFTAWVFDLICRRRPRPASTSPTAIKNLRRRAASASLCGGQNLLHRNRFAFTAY